MLVNALAHDDDRAYTANVAGPTALLVVKLHKLGERQATPGRLVDKDAHDLFRLLVAIPTERLADTLRQLRDDDLSGSATDHALIYLDMLFAAGPEAAGAVMAGRAEKGVGDPATVAASAVLLAQDLLSSVASGT